MSSTFIINQQQNSIENAKKIQLTYLTIDSVAAVYLCLYARRLRPFGLNAGGFCSEKEDDTEEYGQLCTLEFLLLFEGTWAQGHERRVMGFESILFPCQFFILYYCCGCFSTNF